MIPVRLKIRNFMCYRDNEASLDLSGIHLACISGDNGNGKSALIDAMTWALWGETRAGSDDDLINTTQNEMAVEFEFTVEEQLYRILRKRTRAKRRGGSGQPSLEFQIFTGDDYRPITGNTITQTQQKIIEVLHMDYDTFINSAYLRQGRADEFTRQAPAKRKEVLGNILGLSVYDELEERAREMVRENASEVSQLESSIAEIAEEAARKTEYEAELADAQGLLSQQEAATREKETARNTLKQKKENLENKRVQLEELESRQAKNARDLKTWEQQVEQLQIRIKKYEGLIERRETIEKNYAEFTETKRIHEKLEQDFRKSVNLERQKAQLEDRIKDAGHKLNTEHTLIEREISSRNEKLQRLPEVKKEREGVLQQLKQLSEPENAVRQKEKEISELQTQASRVEAQKSRLEQDIREVSEKIDLIASHVDSHEGAKCPLCETELTREGLQLILTKYTNEKQEKSGLLQLSQSEIEKTGNQLRTLEAEKEDLGKSLNEQKQSYQDRSAVLTREIADIEEAGQQIAEFKQGLAAIEERLVSRDFAANEQALLASIEKDIEELAYDAALHEETRTQLAAMENREPEKRGLDEALQQIESEKTALSSAVEAIDGLHTGLEEDRAKRQAIDAELAELPRISDELAQVEAEYQRAANELRKIQENIGSIKSRIERCLELEARKKEKETRLTAISKESGIYKELAKAFGKTGIQVLLIELALPEIENEANLLLGRMTDNRMHVKFETQRETKKGSIHETLDIDIADELGTRNYEMYSGGEAFRINFAIRIALSRLLAKRAGARLPTMIIDEGFGTQDETGMEKLKEVINSIQEDFDKILVITHMNELKDAFPVRIDVVKGAEGSTISVN